MSGLTLLLSVLLAGSSTVRGQVPASTPGLTLGQAIDRALTSNPALAAARLRRPIGAAAILVAGEHLNPEVAYEESKETPHRSIGVTFPIETGGKRQRRVDLANATVAVSEAEIAQVTAEIRNDVRRAYFEVVAADLAVQFADDLRTLAQRARDAANARVVAGDVPRSDLTQSDLALASSESDLVAARGEAAALRAELNALLGQPFEAPLTLAESFADGVLPTRDQAIGQAAEVNGELQLLDRRIAEQSARLTLASALTKPDLAFGVTLTNDAEPEFRYGWRLNFALTVPVFTTHRAGVRVEEATLAQLRAERDAAGLRMNAAIVAAVDRAEAARERLTRYQSTILPLALEAEQQAQVAYSGGQIGLPALVFALQTARDTRQRGLSAGLDYQHALADLERAIGATR